MQFPSCMFLLRFSLALFRGDKLIFAIHFQCFNLAHVLFEHILHHIKKMHPNDLWFLYTYLPYAYRFRHTR